MADPGTLAVIGMASSAAGGLLGASSAEASGAAQSRTYAYQAGVAQMNKRIALQNRDYAIESGEQEAGQFGLKARQVAGAIRARQGSSNLDVNQGSAVDVQQSNAAVARMDLATIRNNAARVAYGYEVEAANASAQSDLYNMAAKDARKAGHMNAIASLIGGVSSVSSKWQQSKQFGML